MKAIRVKAHAKINLYLNILGKRPDGYHDVENIMQSIDLADELTFVPADAGEIIIESVPKFIPDEENLIWKAAQLLRSEVKASKKGAKINLIKKIPWEAGLAGGSTDAAATLAALNSLWDLNLSLDHLQVLAGNLGADVPFCLRGGTMLAQGRGNQLIPLQALPFCYVVIAKPPFGLATRAVYQQYDQSQKGGHLPGVTGLVKALGKGSLQRICREMVNVFEDVVFPQYPEVQELKQKALAAGACGALLSGSGPSIFALASTGPKAQEIAEALEKICPTVIVSTVHPNGLDLKTLVV